MGWEKPGRDAERIDLDGFSGGRVEYEFLVKIKENPPVETLRKLDEALDLAIQDGVLDILIKRPGWSQYPVEVDGAAKLGKLLHLDDVGRIYGAITILGRIPRTQRDETGA